MAGPLAGVRVLECAQIMAGPTCGALLADLGADVVKVEKIAGGDDARAYREPRVGGVSAPFLVMNRNKRGVALDLKHPGGRDALLRMVDEADVLVENYRPGTMDKLGLGWDVLRARRPSLIYCAISGYGLTGPLGGGGGFDLVAQAFAGLMSITGEAGRPPVKVGSSVADLNAGLLAATGILAAYVHRLRTGEGQRVDTSLMEAALHQTGWHASVWFATGRSPEPLGSGHVLAAPYQAFHARARRTGSGSATWSAAPSGRPIRASSTTRPGWRTCRPWSRRSMPCSPRATVPNGWRRSSARACPRARCTRSARRCRTRRRGRAAWWSSSTTRSQAARTRSVRR